jgi:hypothetical protein
LSFEFLIVCNSLYGKKRPLYRSLYPDNRNFYSLLSLK